MKRIPKKGFDLKGDEDGRTGRLGRQQRQVTEVRLDTEEGEKPVSDVQQRDRAGRMCSRLAIRTEMEIIIIMSEMSERR